MRVIKIAMLVAAAVTLFGCQVTSMTVKSPGHTSSPGVIGYYKRYPHHHRYDDNLGLYIYLESPDTYYSNNYYYRWSITLGHWERAHEPRGKWRRAYEHQIPSKLYKKRLKRKKKFKKEPNLRHMHQPMDITKSTPIVIAMIMTWAYTSF